MRIQPMGEEQLKKALSIPDLSDPKNGVHAINLVLEQLVAHFASLPNWPEPRIFRKSPVTTVEENFDRLLFPHSAECRSSRNTRYVSKETLLRGHSAAMIPSILEELASEPGDDFLVFCPGICFRRDVVDRTHTGEPHQLDIWRIKKGGTPFGRTDLLNLVDEVVRAAIPGKGYRANEAIHPYTKNGLEVEINIDESWLELLECGEAHPTVLKASGLDPSTYSGLALGLGIDRLVMLAKGIDDIRLLRSEDPRVQAQMMNLEPFKKVSKFPSIQRDMSLSVSETILEEDICEKVQELLGSDVEALEEVIILSETAYANLPPQAIERLGIKEGQKNVLVRIILRSHSRSLTQEEANVLRDRVHLGLDESQTGGYLG